MDGRPLEVTVLSGSLGSGKTTLLVDWLKAEPRSDVGLIVNEAGAIDVDGALVASQKGDRPVRLLPSGCLCCSMKDDLVGAVEQLIDARYRSDGTLLRKIVIETSGLARPVSVVGSLLTPELRQHGLSIQVVCTFDCRHGPAALARGGPLRAQLATAQRIVLTKLDLAGDHGAAAMVDGLRRLNPLADYAAASDRGELVRQAFLPARRIDAGNFHELIPSGAADTGHDDVRIASYALDGLLSWPEFSARLDDLAAFLGERLLRAKFLLLVEGVADPVLLQSVGPRFSNPTAVPGLALEASRLVFIFQDIDLPCFRERFDETIGALAQLSGIQEGLPS